MILAPKLIYNQYNRIMDLDISSHSYSYLSFAKYKTHIYKTESSINCYVKTGFQQSENEMIFYLSQHITINFKGITI